jgi:predicted phage replisome organizer
MSDNKKYYYLKLKENFFDREEIKVIKGMDKGDTYVCIMLEMYLRSLKREGRLMMTDTIPFNLQTLASVLSRDVDEVKFAIDLFTQFDLIEMLDSGSMFMSDIQNFIGHGSSEAERKALYRKRIKEEKKEIGHCPDVRPPEIELEKEIELDTEIKKKKEVRHNHGEYKNVLLTDSQLEKIKLDFPHNWDSLIKELDEGIELKGYKYKNHNLALRKWAKNVKPAKGARNTSGQHAEALTIPELN